VDGRQNRDGLLRDVDASEDGRGLGDTGQALVENVRRQVAELKEDVVLVRTNTATLADLDGHTARHDVARRKVLGRRRVTLHEALALRVKQVPALTTRT
jgi:hypothetical protein